MDRSTASEATRCLERLSAGDSNAAESLMKLLYGELHALAEQNMRRERPDHTLQPTALVNEIWLELAAGRNVQWESRSHFLCLAAKAMRAALVDHARRRHAQKRGGSGARLELDDALAVFDQRATDVLALHEALERLCAKDAELARIVELRFFGGLTSEETGRVVGLSVRQVEGAWVAARGWLLRELRKGEG